MAAETPATVPALTKLTRLDLSNNRLTDGLPDALTALTQVRVAGNAFTRCVPHGLWAAASHDLATLGLPDCRLTASYGAPQTTGVVDAQGEYAFFTATGTAITTYEGLRNDVARLIIHERDTAGTSWAWFYDDVEEGDMFEWRKANDCWVRYVVDEVLADPSATLKALSVEHYAYAYAGCSGTVSLTGNRTLTWAPAILSHPDFTTAIRFGPFILYQPGWKGEYEDSERTALQHGEPGEQRAGRIFSTDLATVRRHPLWREPDLPDGWTLTSAEAGTDGQYGYWAHYAPPGGGFGVNIVIGHRDYLPFSRYSSSTGSARVQELRIIDGHPALVEYSPIGTTVPSPSYISIYHDATGIFYEAFGWAPSLRRAGADAMIAIVRSLYLNEGDE